MLSLASKRRVNRSLPLELPERLREEILAGTKQARTEEEGGGKEGAEAKKVVGPAAMMDKDGGAVRELELVVINPPVFYVPKRKRQLVLVSFL